MLDSRIPTPQQVADALLAGNAALVFEAAQAYLESGGLAFLADALIQPTLEHVGQRWCERLANAAETNAATGLLSELLSSLLPSPSWEPRGPTAVVACVQGERHELGARLVSHLLSLEGWQVYFLGADAPAADLAQLVARVEPAFVGLSVTLEERLPNAWYTISSLRHTVPGIRIVVGGRASAALLHAEEPVRPDVVACKASEILTLTRSWSIETSGWSAPWP
ncbi:MAG: cobalamin B12-binding domain-containing protein [Myxococcaceae bacterium]|nr:cobalamin B12-binding domain-containing protein [Myxococcaceae bacterium]